MARLAASASPDRQGDSASLPARVTRTTRSQSREVDDMLPPPRRNRNRNKRNAKQSSVESDASAFDDHTAANLRRAAAGTGLPTLDEQESEDLNSNVIDPALGQDEDPSLSFPDRRASFSAEPTTFTQEEAAELDKDVIIDAIPGLNIAAEQLLEALAPPNVDSLVPVWEQIATHASKSSKLFRRRYDALKQPRVDFGSQDYIDPSIVLGVLGVETTRNLDQGIWRPDPVIHKANLAQFMRDLIYFRYGPSITDMSTPPTNPLNVLELAEHKFPRVVASGYYRDQEFDLCLDLSTQLAIARIADPGYEPIAAIESTFSVLDDNKMAVFRHESAFQMETLNSDKYNELHTKINKRTSDLKAPFADAGKLSREEVDRNADILRRQFPWDRFVVEAYTYCIERKRELNSNIASAGGVEGIHIALSEKIDIVEKGERETHLRRSIAAGATPKKAVSSDAIKLLKERRKRMSASINGTPAQRPAPTAQMMQPTGTAAQPRDDQVLHTNDDSWIRADEDDYDPQAGPSNDQYTKTAANALGEMSQLDLLNKTLNKAKNKAKNKPLSIMDRQEDAQRISFDSQSSPYPVQFRLPQSSANIDPRIQPPQNKRRRDDSEDQYDEINPTQDDGYTFQTDTRGPAGPDERHRKAPASTQRPSHFSQYGQASSANPRYSSQASARPSPAKRQRKNPGASLPPPTQPSPDDPAGVGSTQYMQHQRELAARNRIGSQAARPPQQRRGWTNDEEIALINLIAEHGDDGIKWAQIKYQDEAGLKLLAGRKAEDMRFKARNMKTTILLAGSTLPTNFEHIVLDKKAKDKLANNGIVYHQDRIRQVSSRLDDTATPMDD